MKNTAIKKLDILETIKFIRKLVIIALFADDYLMNIFVLKGGNAIDIIFGISDRASIDIDVSMADDFDSDKIEEIQQRLEKALIQVFDDHSYHVFDVTLEAKPKVPYQEVKDFWGGYLLQFKVIERDKAQNTSHELMRKQALAIGPGNSVKFKVDISKFEYCETKEETELDGYTIYVYTPVMVVFEKLRAICQQMSNYTETIHQVPRPRARDFFDIHRIITKLNLDSQLFKEENLAILKAIFKAKHVPIELLFKISQERDFHAGDFYSLKDTVSDKKSLKDFNFYFDYVLSSVEQLETFWKK